MDQDEASTAAITASEHSNSSGQAFGGGSENDESEQSASDSESHDHCIVKSSEKKKRPDGRKMRRIMANRRSARESRERRKQLLEDLQASVDKLAAENAEVAKVNSALRQELVRLLHESGLSAAFST
jgi:hypothetical protein